MFTSLFHSHGGNMGMSPISLQHFLSSHPPTPLTPPSPQLPSSVNRIYSLAHPTTPNYPLNLVAATVLPLQGFWNSLIYLTTSHSICADLFNTHIMAPIRRRRRGVTGPIPFLGPGSHRERLGSVESASYAKDFLRN